ncbi:DNA-directed RNA polymerase subunit beta', partial [Eubacterium sp.]|uniref:DNA-directed RNA polymerase subunit beta' n=1 Tax=Eubacterium sp. TaxID=142586 RepID=UPI003F0723DC
NRPLKSLSDMLKGKQGRFRQNLLGKRVDYSGRSVIVVGPELKMYQCGLPKEMAIELFKPFVMKRLVETNIASNIKQARKMVEKADRSEVWDALEVVIKDHPVMLNRAPTLHRLGIQAFEPVLVEGRAIKLHPLACTAFNADFDGDQMAVHVPLSAEAQAEARMLMLASNNLLKPSDGKPVAVPSQDMVIGSYYLTMIKDGEPGCPYTEVINGEEVKRYRIFRDVDEAMMAYQEGSLGLHAECKIRFSGEINGEMKSSIVTTTIGRVIFNKPVPQDLGFVDRTVPGNEFVPEVSFVVKKGGLGKIADACIRTHGVSIASRVLDDIKNQGYKYSTVSGTTVAVIDALIPEKKKEFLAEAEAKVDEITTNYNYGLITNEERYSQVVKAWETCTNKVSDELTNNFDGTHNPIHMMVDSGARGSTSQLRQLAGMRGLIANTSGATIEIPIRANYREGLNILEYFISSRGARKGLTDTALRTADSGYLTRRLVDVSQDVIIRDDDCGCHDGIEVYAIMDGNRVLESLEERLVGRFAAEPIVHPETGEVLMDTDRIMNEDDAARIAAAGIKKVKIRSLITCKSRHGVCRKCYGSNLAFNEPVQVGEAVGIIAAQSIGEPGTQLTMRTFHTGGVAGGEDITQGLPRVEELFEARKPKQLAILSEISGTVRFEEIKKTRHVVVFNEETGDEKKYLIPYGYRLCENIVEGAHIEKGTELTLGSKNPHDVLAILGEEAVYNYLIKEVQYAYRTQGVDINDKHIEVIVRQMLKKCIVDEAGDTDLISGTNVDVAAVAEANDKIDARIAAGETELKKATYIPLLLGITKASLATDSFLSAASFQETTRVLTDAAIRGKSDPLIGLKENVLIGKLVPAGTGMSVFRKVDVVPSYFSAESGIEIKDLEQLQQLLTNSNN